MASISLREGCPITEILTEPKPYVDPETIFEVRSYVQGQNTISSLTPIGGGVERFQIGVVHDYVMGGQQFQGQGVFQIKAETIEEAFATLPLAVEDAKRAIEAEGRKQMLMAGMNQQAIDKMHEAIVCGNGGFKRRS